MADFDKQPISRVDLVNNVMMGGSTTSSVACEGVTKGNIKTITYVPGIQCCIVELSNKPTCLIPMSNVRAMWPLVEKPAQVSIKK